MVAGALEAVLAGAEVPAEVIVVDQSETPALDVPPAAARRGVEVRHVPSATTGLSAARNAGIALAREPVVAMIDDDAVVTPTWAQAVDDAMRLGGPRTAVTGRVVPGPTPTGREYVPSCNVSTTPAVFRGRIGRDVLFGNNFAIPRAAIEEIGWFDERLGAGARWRAADDNDFGHRLLDAGYTIRFVPEAEVTHLAWRTTRQLLHLRWSYGRGQGGFYAKHARLGDRYTMRRLARDAGASARAAARFGIRLDPWAATHAAHLCGLVSGFAEWLAVRPPEPRPTVVA
jgi:GT2 family glycosyltransferase